MACSRPLPPVPTELSPTIEASHHSTLEVDPNCCIERDGSSAPILSHDSMGYTDEKIIGFDTGKIVNYNDVDKQAVVAESHDVQPDPSHPMKQTRILGVRRIIFWTLLSIALLLTVIIVGASVGSTIAKRNRQHNSTEQDTTEQDIAVPPESRPPTPRARYANTGLSAITWTDLNGTLHKRVYYQDSNDKLREAAWDNSTALGAPWDINTISDRVKPGTPIASAAGYPHASFNYSLVKNVYYMSANGGLSERQAPSNDSQAWEDDNFSGLYGGANSTFLAVYWNQNIRRESQELVVLFQEENFANGITQARYISNKTESYPWVANNFGFSQPKGSTFAMVLASFRSGKHLMLYTVDDARSLQQHEYTISDTDLVPGPVVSLTSEQSTGLKVEPRSPLAVVSQDNQPAYDTDTMPECTRSRPLTNLIFFATADRSALVLSAWNCSSGFLDNTAEIKPLQKANTTYLSLAATNDRVSGDGDLYVMFDSGNGPQVEEWTVPKRAGDPWVRGRNVTNDFNV